MQLSWNDVRGGASLEERDTNSVRPAPHDAHGAWFRIETDAEIE